MQEKERDKRDKDKEGKEKDKKTVNGHVFTPVSSGQLLQCSHCNKAFNNKEAFQCTREYLFLSSPVCSSPLFSRSFVCSLIVCDSPRFLLLQV